jgi:hypothetical protein
MRRTILGVTLRAFGTSGEASDKLRVGEAASRRER